MSFAFAHLVLLSLSVSAQAVKTQVLHDASIALDRGNVTTMACKKEDIPTLEYLKETAGTTSRIHLGSADKENKCKANAKEGSECFVNKKGGWCFASGNEEKYCFPLGSGAKGCCRGGYYRDYLCPDDHYCMNNQCIEPVEVSDAKRQGDCFGIWYTNKKKCYKVALGSGGCEQDSHCFPDPAAVHGVVCTNEAAGRFCREKMVGFQKFDCFSSEQCLPYKESEGGEEYATACIHEGYAKTECAFAEGAECEGPGQCASKTCRDHICTVAPVIEKEGNCDPDEAKLPNPLCKTDYCNSRGKCAKKLVGMPCNTNRECLSTFCSPAPASCPWTNETLSAYAQKSGKYEKRICKHSGHGHSKHTGWDFDRCEWFKINDEIEVTPEDNRCAEAKGGCPCEWCQECDDYGRCVKVDFLRADEDLDK